MRKLKQRDYLERERLVLEHLPQIKTLARRLGHLLPPNVEVCDLVSAGIIGFMNAIANFDPSRGAKLRTYAEFRIRGAMLDCLRGLDWAPRSLRKQSKRLARICRILEQKLGRVPAPEEVCAEMKIGLEKLHQIAGDLQSVNLDSLDGGADSAAKREQEPLLATLACSPKSLPSHQYEVSETRDILSGAIDSLPRQQRLVISLRYYEEMSILDIARILDVNPSRISQLHMKALSALRTRLGKLDIAA